MSALEHWPDLDDIGYEYWRELRLAEAEAMGTWQHRPSELYRTHWQHSPAEAFPACGRGQATPLLTGDPLLVTCRACRQRQLREAA